ncbi:MAG: transporter, partial [Acidimicrobiaceae bacterium]|nr:transporter [Acidimicrobiaceae bacterium]
ALYAALAQAVILGHRGSGLVNFGQGAMAMIIAYTYRQLKVSGELLILPLPNPLKPIEGIVHKSGGSIHLWSFPTFVDLGGPMATWSAILISLAYAAVLGLLVHFLIFRPMRYASGLAKVAASVGIMLTLQAAASLRFGTDGRTVPTMLPSSTIPIFGTSAPINRLILAVAAIGLAVILAIVYRFSRFGLASEAAATNERGAIASGLSPDRLAAVSWVISSVVGGGIGILFATITTITPTNFTFFIVPALGAALIANLRSLIGAAVGGLLIGVAQSLTIPLQADVGWLRITGLADGIPFLVIIAAMMLRGKSLPVRGGVLAAHLPPCPEPRRIVVPGIVFAVLVVAGLLTLPFDIRGGIINSLVGVLVALSLLVLTGMAGQVSLMQMAIAGASALAMTRVAGDWGIPFPLAPILAAFAAMIVGVVVSIPALRIRGVNLAIATIGAAFAFESLVLNNNDVVGNSENTGSVPDPVLGSLHFGINAHFPVGVTGIPSSGFGLFVLVVALVACAMVVGVRRGKTGRAFLAIRSNERSAASVGLNVSAVKVMAFAVSAFLAGLAGAVTAYQFQALNTANYATLASVATFALVYVAGISTIFGSLLAGLIFTGGLGTALLSRFFHMGEYQNLAAGVGLIVMAVQNPDGMGVLLSSRLRKLRLGAFAAALGRGHHVVPPAFEQQASAGLAPKQTEPV